MELLVPAVAELPLCFLRPLSLLRTLPDRLTLPPSVPVPALGGVCSPKVSRSLEAIDNGRLLPLITVAVSLGAFSYALETARAAASSSAFLPLRTQSTLTQAQSC